ncbi:hypothetical protein HNP88_001160 [Methanococcus maripaludis]|uniref:Glycosyl transferase family 2 n=1 Tax=Methanococcus maripaludis TaxID=39152 RepID=A0A7J9NPA8_METMI|nr:hypothetical protein [Methanococcus maripaludis]MBA2846976.1 hypothetical protein [Methanococcus maripaludis]
MEISIVVVAYNRIKSLKRILDSLSNADYQNEKINLVISIDGPKKNMDNSQIVRLAEEFNWVHGEKRIIKHNGNIGLKKHILKCGDLTNEYGNIILLEDDLFVSPYFYEYAKQTLEYYKDEKSIAGISLFNHCYNETAQLPFFPIETGHDVYFMQIASSWGQIWNKRMWFEFRNWLADHEYISNKEKIPLDVLKWPASSWKKHFIHYLIKEKKYFVYPRISLTTNFMDVGTHHKSKAFILQQPLNYGFKEYKLTKIEDSLSVYDAFCEILPSRIKKMNNKLSIYDFEVDLYGQKDISKINSKYILTHSKCLNYEMGFGLDFKPLEMNIILNNDGDFFKLILKEKAKKKNDDELIRYEYFYKYLSKNTLKLIMKKIVINNSRIWKKICE